MVVGSLPNPNKLDRSSMFFLLLIQAMVVGLEVTCKSDESRSEVLCQSFVGAAPFP